MAAVLTGGILVLLAIGLALPQPSRELFTVVSVSIAVSFTLVGGLVAARRPANPVGWLFLGWGFVAALNTTCTQYWYYAGVLRSGALPGADAAALAAVHTWHPGFAFFILAFLYFPDGTLPSRRWRLVAWLAVIAGLVGLISGTFEYDFARNWFPPPRPEPVFTGDFVAVADAVFGVTVLVLAAMFPVSAISIAVRYRRSSGTVRQQIKWVAFAIILVAVALPASVIIVGDGSFGAPLLPLIPIAAGIAILRYRLFDIDRIINRTIVYASVTAVLALGYAAIVLGLGVLLGLEGESSNVVVAGTTLLAAALFRPLRDRTQRAVDRRFNRRKYDARETIDAFGSRLRTELDLDTLPAALVTVVRETMQPATVGLWLRHR